VFAPPSHISAGTHRRPTESEAAVSTQTAAVRSTPIVPPGRWIVDPTHSSVGFAVKHMGIATVRSKFTEFEGTLAVGQDLAGSRAFGTVKVASISTSEEQRDAHLRSAASSTSTTTPRSRSSRPASRRSMVSHPRSSATSPCTASRAR
jgi:polyisoprenoid-binding protein YceI